MGEPPERGADATRRRLLAAATAEFARHGIAGARVDRIAADARANKAQIYHYFGSKERLFDAVFAGVVTLVLAEVPLDVTDLPGYAARLAQGYESHPEIGRLATWQRLERASSDQVIDLVVASHESKIAAIRAAQERGVVSSRFDARVLLGLILHLAALWASQAPEYLGLVADLSPADRSEVVARSVRALVTDDG